MNNRKLKRKYKAAKIELRVLKSREEVLLEECTYAQRKVEDLTKGLQALNAEREGDQLVIAQLRVNQDTKPNDRVTTPTSYYPRILAT